MMETAGGFMARDVRIYVAGHRGMVGSAVMRSLQAAGYDNLITRTHAELDLSEQAAVRAFFSAERPEYVFLCAARVGGIMNNYTHPAEFIAQNLLIQGNVITEAHRAGVRRLLFLGSSCVYPRDCPQPIKEQYLLTGPLEFTNRPYAVAKIAGIETCWAFNRQYGSRYLAVMPTNLFGPGDNYDLEGSHVLPALIRKMHEAARRGHHAVELWGTGSPRREFLYSDDVGEAAVHILNLPEDVFGRLLEGGEKVPPLINVGWGKDITIAELAAMVAEAVGFVGEIRWDASKPDGTPQKLLDTSRMTELGWRPRVTLRQGIKLAYQDFLENHADRVEGD